MFAKVVEIDPEHHQYHLARYRILRTIRRNRDQTKPQMCEEEIAACERAYKLAPNRLECISNLALLHKDKLWIDGDWVNGQSNIDICVRLYRKSIDLAMDLNLERQLCQFKLQLAALFLHGQWPNLAAFQEEGKSILDECERLYPESTWVLHSMGKLHMHGAYNHRNGPRKFPNHKLAKDYLERSLKICPFNFVCLMDYVKLVYLSASKVSGEEQQQIFQELFQALDNSRRVIKRSHQVSRLDCIMGTILWSFNPYLENVQTSKKKACSLWIKMLQNTPEFEDTLYEYIEKQPFHVGRRGCSQISMSELLKVLQEMKVENEARLPEEIIDKFIEKVEFLASAIPVRKRR